MSLRVLHNSAYRNARFGNTVYGSAKPLARRYVADQYTCILSICPEHRVRAYATSNC